MMKRFANLQVLRVMEEIKEECITCKAPENIRLRVFSQTNDRQYRE